MLFCTIEIDGVDVTNIPEYKRAAYLGRVFQGPMKGTAPDMEIAENLSIAARRGTKRKLRWGVRRAECEKYRELLAALELDPKTAAKVFEITDRIVAENNLTTLMITHNMHDATTYGNRLIMMDEGRIVVDVSGEEKKRITISRLLGLF